jgi:hypothetical protein
MARKLLISRLGAGSITVALCATLPGCNLALQPSTCEGKPASRGMSTVVCPTYDAASETGGTKPDAPSDSMRATTDAPAPDATGDRL